MCRGPLKSTLFPYTTLFRSRSAHGHTSATSTSNRSNVASATIDPARSCAARPEDTPGSSRSEEHTSELQSRGQLVCRLLLEKKKINRCVRHLQLPVLKEARG